MTRLPGYGVKDDAEGGGGVDPAALLLATLAVIVAPLSEAGQWYPTNTFVSGVVAVILGCYIFETDSRRELTSAWHQLPASIALALVVGIGLAWPLQERVIRPWTGRTGDELGELTTYWCIPITVLLAVAIFAVIRQTAKFESREGGLKGR